MLLHPRITDLEAGGRVFWYDVMSLVNTDARCIECGFFSPRPLRLAVCRKFGKEIFQDHLSIFLWKKENRR